MVARVLTRFVVRAGLVGLACAALACGSASSSSITAPSAAKCAVAATNNTSEVPATGGNGSITVATARDCTWSAAADAPWVTLAERSGQGPATVNYSVLANPNGTPRHSRVVVGESAIDVAQAAAACRYDVSPAALNVAATAQQASVTISAPNGCAWTARTDAAWIAGLAPADGNGSGTLRFAISANPNAARTGTVVVGDATIRVIQAAAPDVPPAPQPPVPEPTPVPPPTPGPSPSPTPPPPACTFGVAPDRTSVSPSGDDVTIAVSVSSGCTWTAASNVSWITISSPATGAGNGSVRATVAANSGAARTGTITVAGKTVTIEQAARPTPTCSYAIKPNDYHAGRGPDTIAIDVTADAGCTWTAATDAPWVTIAAGRSGTGNGTVRLEIPANSGPARTATVTIAGKTFTLMQNGGCTPAIKPGYYDAGRGPDDIRIRVTAEPGCSWSAASTVSWVSVAEGATGSGDGTVRLLVQANSGPARAVTLTIAGQPFALTQQGPH